MEQTFTGYYDSPVGWVEVRCTADAVTSLRFTEEEGTARGSTSLLDEAIRQLDAYFQGSRHTFDLPVHLDGTPFQQAVWEQVRAVPFGRTASYQHVATSLGKPDAVRAVGTANGRNPCALLVPCHRVVGVDGRLTGYRGGLWRKEWLLRHEGALLL